MHKNSQSTIPLNPPAAAVNSEARLIKLERSNARWRAAALAGLAGAIGLVVGGMGQPNSRTDYDYVATNDSIFRIDGAGNIETIKIDNGRRSPDGYYDWGQVRIDRSRPNPPRP
ncbi:MAG: hypothetical protein AB8F26_13180 [Phycisphaerales bacterium]